MAVPSRGAAVRLLLDLEPQPYLLEHSSAVAEIAAFLGRRIAERGVAINRPLVEAAAFLHDIDRALPADDPRRQRGHGDAGAAWLSEHGYGELAGAVAHHPVGRLGDDAHYTRWIAVAALEERVVAYADKRARADVVSLDERFADWLRRHPEHAASLARARERAERLEMEVCAAAGIAPADVARAAWVAEAMAAAR